jgi:hypothetical protein
MKPLLPYNARCYVAPCLLLIDMAKFQINLRITAEEYLKSYSGSIKDVVAMSTDGRNVRFPAKILRPYVTRQGINGVFSIYVTSDNRFERIEKIG